MCPARRFSDVSTLLICTPTPVLGLICDPDVPCLQNRQDQARGPPIIMPIQQNTTMQQNIQVPRCCENTYRFGLSGSKEALITLRSPESSDLAKLVHYGPAGKGCAVIPRFLWIGKPTTIMSIIIRSIWHQVMVRSRECDESVTMNSLR